MRTLLLSGCVLLLAACKSEQSSGGPTVTVERFLVAQSCFVQCQQSAPPAQELNLPNRCATSIPADGCALIGGSDIVRVAADYGSVPIDNSVAAVPPTLTLVEDNTSVAAPSAMSPGRGTDNRFFAASSFTVPDAVVHALVFQASASSSYTTDLGGFSVTPLEPTVTLSGCTTAPPSCTLQSGVGQASVNIVAAALTSPPTATVTPSLDGISGAPATVSLGPNDQTTIAGSLVLNVPDDPGGTWSFAVTVGNQTVSAQAQILSTTLAVSVENCPTGGVCALLSDAGAATVVVSAPVGLIATTGTVTSFVNGVTSLGQPLTLSETVGANRLGYVSFPPPPSGTTWQFQAVFGRESGTSEAITVE